MRFKTYKLQTVLSKNFVDELNMTKLVIYHYNRTNYESVIAECISDKNLDKFNKRNELAFLLDSIFKCGCPNPFIFDSVLISYYKMPMVLLLNDELLNKTNIDGYLIYYDISNLSNDIVDVDVIDDDDGNQNYQCLIS